MDSEGEGGEQSQIQGKGIYYQFFVRIKILSWNVRGANSAEKRKLIKAFLKGFKADLVCVQETKPKGLTHGTIRRLMAGKFVDWVAAKSEGASGGILIFWDSRVLQLVEVEESHYSLS